MRSYSVLVLSVFAVTFLLVSGAQAGKGGKGKNRKNGENNSDNSSGTIEFIIDHAVELKVTPEQIKKLELLQDAEEKVMSDPAVQAIVTKIKEAKTAGNTSLVTEQKARLADKIRERTGGQFGLLQDELKKILSPEQLAARDELKKGKAKPDDGKAKDSNTPAKTTAPPNPFEL